MKQTVTRVPILMYHQILPVPVPAFQKYIVRPSAFTAQMRYVKCAGFTSIDLDTLVRHRTQHEPLVPRPVIITFDDGFRDSATYAVPILQKFGLTATFFLVAGLMGESSRWLEQERGIDFPLMDWATARHVEAAGLHCESHTMTHPHLATLSPDAVCDELATSRRLLEGNLDHEVKHVAYPFGSYNAAVRQVANETGYASACSVRSGLSRPDDDLLALRRVHIDGRDTLITFISRLYTGRSPQELISRTRRRMWHSSPRVRGG